MHPTRAPPSSLVQDVRVTLGLPANIRGCLFDLDGVLTRTATVHAKAWKQTFDELLAERAHGGDFAPFTDDDYIAYVDGKPREAGVRDFLASRDIQLPDGTRDDTPSDATVWGIGNRKNELVLDLIRRDGVDVFDDARRYLELVTAAGLRRAVVSSSANTATVLQVSGLAALVEGRVDGVTLAEQHLPGKPAPDSFLAGARLLDLPAADCAVFEDALAGVQAGHAAGCYTVGVDRVRDGVHGDGLRSHGADVVVAELTDLTDQTEGRP